MATEIVMPKLGWTMEEGTLVEWKKQDGDRVSPGEIYMLVESDKSVNEIESFEEGILRKLPNGPNVGETVKVGTVIGYLLAPGEKAPFEKDAPSVQTSSAVAKPASAAAHEAGHQLAPVLRNGLPRISPRALRVARELGVDWKSLTGSGTSARILERDVRNAHARPAVAPQALAGPVSQPAGTAPKAPALTIAAAPAVVTPPSATRRLIAQRLQTSAQTTAAVTLTTEIDATELVKLREVLKTRTGYVVPAYTDLFAKICALSLRLHPAINASWTDGGIVARDGQDIGIAVQTDRGLLVPVLRSPATKSVATVATESAALIQQAREGTLGAGAMQGASATITNLGMFGVDGFTPIVNLPESAILGMGRIVPKVVVIDEATEKTAIRKMMVLSLTFDHRLVDGAPAAQFLATIREYAEQPYLWLTG